MTLTLQRLHYEEDGVFSMLMKEDGSVLAFTCEHSYAGDRPKLYVGSFTCKRGVHQLHSGPAFETFEITGVNGHTNILFHSGNVEDDSEGCVLVGEEFGEINEKKAVLRSKEAFKSLMSVLEGLDSFQLDVK